MKRNVSGLMVAALLGLSAAASATPVVYDFVGTVTAATGTDLGIYAIGDQVTGKYTIDLAQANAAQSSAGGVSPGSLWDLQSFGGSAFPGSPTPKGYLFSTTLNGKPGYATGKVKSSGTASVVESSPNQFYYGAEYQYAYDATLGYYNSRNSILDLQGGTLAESTNGLPSVTGYDPLSSFGSVFTQLCATCEGGQLDFSIDSLFKEPSRNKVPEPATLSLLGLGLAGMRLLRTRKSS